jgi:hypothetical protein
MTLIERLREASDRIEDRDRHDLLDEAADRIGELELLLAKAGYSIDFLRRFENVQRRLNEADALLSDIRKAGMSWRTPGKWN